MSIVNPQHDVEYPESDGKPMGETELHRNWIIRIADILRQRYCEQPVYVACDLLVYYEEGHPTRFVVPDVFVIRNCRKDLRRTFKIWEEQRVPEVIFEVTSRSTRTNDTVDKPVLYERLGVKEYFLFDPTAEYIEQGLEGYRLVDGVLEAIPQSEGRVACETLGIDLVCRDQQLSILDSVSGDELLTEAQTERRAKEGERQAKEIEMLAKEAERRAKETALRAKETALRATETALREKETALHAEAEAIKERDAELARREAAEHRVRELEAELQRQRERDSN